MKINKDHLPWNRKILWICPECGIVNVWNWEDAVRAAKRLKINVNTEIAISHGSCFDNVCGGCQANIVSSESPILAPCYTH